MCDLFKANESSWLLLSVNVQPAYCEMQLRHGLRFETTYRQFIIVKSVEYYVPQSVCIPVGSHASSRTSHTSALLFSYKYILFSP
jgi:hypothetical protein